MTAREIAHRIALLCWQARAECDAAISHAMSAAESLKRIP